MDNIYSFSTGIPRLVNIICNLLLLTAFAEKTKEINEEMVIDIIKDLQGETSTSSRNDMTEGKQALLNALELSPAEDEDHSSPAPVRKPQNGEKNIRLLLKDISLRVLALEEEHSCVRVQDLAGLVHRLELLEKSKQQSVPVTKVQIAPTASPQNDSSWQPTHARATGPQNEPDANRGF
jgi:hypothetical protein